MSTGTPDEDGGKRDYTDPTVPGAAPDEERPAGDPPGPDTGETRPRDEADPDKPDVEPDEGNTYEGPAPSG